MERELFFFFLSFYSSSLVIIIHLYILCVTIEVYLFYYIIFFFSLLKARQYVSVSRNKVCTRWVSAIMHRPEILPDLQSRMPAITQSLLKIPRANS